MEKRVCRRRPPQDRKETGLRVWTRMLIDTMARLGTFDKKTLLANDTSGAITLRRINDVVAILLGAGFIAKGPAKKHFHFVGIEGTRRLFDGTGGPVPMIEKRIRYYGYKMVELLTQKPSWKTWDIRAALERDVHGFPTRRTYDVVSVFLGAGLVRKCAGKRIETLVSTTVPQRTVFTISNEDAIAILPELGQHLSSSSSSNNSNEGNVLLLNETY